MTNLNEKYSIIKPLGSQVKRKFGSVFLIQNKLTSELAVLKSITKSEVNHHLQERLLKEAEFSFEFPGLPKTIEIIENSIEINVIKSYSKGVTLDEFWKIIKRKNQKNTVLIILEKLTDLLNYIGNKNIVHCDLKPSNIIINYVNGEIEVSLIDFGMALKTDEVNHRQTLFPLGFAAPELLLNQLQLIDHRTDQFSLGVIIWKLFADKLPLTHPNPSIFTNLQLTYPLPDHYDLPKGYYPVLLKMCNKHQFKTAPNLIKQDELVTNLRDGMKGRYENLEEVFQAFQNLPTRKKIFGF
ncbi:MAG: hypothetical protein RI883_1737 [Bacteroidota bacterium]|jgi:serine/threonine protein kinase